LNGENLKQKFENVKENLDRKEKGKKKRKTLARLVFLSPAHYRIPALTRASPVRGLHILVRGPGLGERSCWLVGPTSHLPQSHLHAPTNRVQCATIRYRSTACADFLIRAHINRPAPFPASAYHYLIRELHKHHVPRITPDRRSEPINRPRVFALLRRVWLALFRAGLATKAR
jgi:hypothetical protein